MLRPVTPPDDSSLADSLSMHKDKQTTSNSSTNIKFNPNRVSERKIFVTGNPESLLSKLFESAEEKPTPSKKSERLLPGTSYKTVIPPGSNSMRRGRLVSTISSTLCTTDSLYVFYNSMYNDFQLNAKV